MGSRPEIEAWFAEIRSPAESTLRRVREIILGADLRMIDYLKYGTLVFASDTDMASFVQVKAKAASLMFHRGARIKGDFPHLEGSGPSARFMRFADEAEADARAEELTRVVVAWCELGEVAPRRG